MSRSRVDVVVPFAGSAAALAALVARLELLTLRDGDTVSVVDNRPPEVESLDTPEGSGTVFTIEDEDGNAAVIWVEPDEVEGL